MLAADDEGIDTHDIRECTGSFLEHRVDIAEAKVCLLLDGGGYLIVGRDPELPGADQNAVAGRDFHAVAVARKPRPDSLWRGVVPRQTRRKGRPGAPANW